MGKRTCPFLPLQFERLSPEEQWRRATESEARLQTRRTVRQFSSEPVSLELIETAIRIAGRAPSGGESATVAIRGAF